MYKEFMMMMGLVMSFFSPVKVIAENSAENAPTKDDAADEAAEKKCPAALDFTFRELDGDQQINLCETYKGKVVLIVNTASKCGFTPQFESLEDLHEKYKDKGFSVLGFPSNDFGSQDPGSEKQIADFCRLTYGVKFPMFEKTHASKDKASPLYQTLGELSGKYPKWNFHKYLLSTEGELIASFSSFVKPMDKRLVDMIEANLPE